MSSEVKKKAVGAKTCGYEVILDNGEREVTLDIKRARKVAKFHEGKASIVRRCVINKYRDGKRDD